jgi:multidrug efflux pump subunit AcrA (membrane-fusion protein)
MLLKPMMTTNVEIIKQEKKGVLLVPMIAVIHKRDDSGATTTTSDSGATQAASASTAPATEASASPRHGRRGDRKARTSESFPGTVTVLKADGSKETRDVLVGMDDEVHYEIIKGVEEGETVLLNKASASSRFSNNGANRRLARSTGG